MVAQFRPIVICLAVWLGLMFMQSNAAMADDGPWKSRQTPRVVITAPPAFFGGWAPTVQVATMVVAPAAPGTIVIAPTRDQPWRYR